MRGSGLSRRAFVSSGLRLGGAAVLGPGLPADGQGPANDREIWLELLQRVSEPVLGALGRRELRRTMPVEAVRGHVAERTVGTHLEALGRLLAGLGPWLELEPGPGETARETALRVRYRALVTEGLVSALDPRSPDAMRFGESAQTLVDSSFLALAMLRAPKQMLGTMDAATRGRLIAALESERKILPGYNNWLLFAALNEALLHRLGASWDRLRVDYALRQLEAWYVGDGTYGDGPHYHADFYNSYVIHPYLLALMDELGEEPAWQGMAAGIRERAVRYAAIQERMISPAGEFPVLGRSITYRAGAFHLLADVARRRMLPAALTPAGVRCALTAVQNRTLGAKGTFSQGGWLQIGLAGHQPSLGETYISTGSLYLCSAAWLPLGLDAGDAFWAGGAADWTQKAVWAGRDAAADHAV